MNSTWTLRAACWRAFGQRAEEYGWRRHGRWPWLLLLMMMPGVGVAGEAGPWTVAPVVPSQRQLFPPGAVRLGEGPFKAVQDANHAYLLRLEPDRLLAQFRVEAGLEPKAPPYGGWEAPAPAGKTWSLAGHSLGHYLSAASLMYRLTGDERLRERVGYMARELQACQGRRGDGSLVAFPHAGELAADIRAGRVETVDKYWAPFYTIHKELAGLRDAWLWAGDATAREVLVRLADWCGDLVKDLPEARRERLLQMEHGGMAEVLADVYALTGEARHLEYARLFVHRALRDPLAAGEDTLTGKHANTQVPKFTGFQRIHELAGDQAEGAAAAFFWETVVGRRTWVNGGNSIHEHFPEPAAMAQHLTDEGGPETCNTYNMLRLTAALHRTQPAPAQLDYYENALFNHLLASQAPLPGAGAFVYYTPLRPQYARSYGTDVHSFWCCTGTGMENPARYEELIYSHTDDALWVNLFVASEVRWAARGLVVRQETRFPDEARTTLVVVEAPSEPVTLRIRHPSWVSGSRLAMRLNGERLNAATDPGGFAALTRTWEPGDRLRVRLPMALRVVRPAHSPGWVSLFHGPILLAGELGSEGLTRADFFGSYTPAKALTPLAKAPVLIADTDEDILARVEAVPGRPGLFRTRGLVKPADVMLAPFFRVHFQRYAFYWQLSSPSAWEQRQREVAAAEQRERDLDACTVDRVRIGEQQPEMDHNLRFEHSQAGTGPHGRRWRDARDGGWFSYELRLPPPGGRPVLQVLYWGGDRGREFEVQVEGQVIAHQKLEGGVQDFVGVEYPLDEALVAGRERVTVRFQSRAGQTAGGIFDLRMLTAPSGGAGPSAAGAPGALRAEARAPSGGAGPSAAGAPGPIRRLEPPELGFFSKRLDYEGIPIKAHADVADEALSAAWERLSRMLGSLPGVRTRLREAGAALHIIGRDQVTTDLPEWRQDKGKPLAEYHGLTRDERTRGMGGLLASCGEENLLRLESDRYRGRDICVHEFAHNILEHGAPRAFRQRVREQHRRSLERGRWVGAYAASNPHEFFAELAMWYFGTHGDRGMQGPPPADGPEGLRAYDPEAFALLDDFFRGRWETPADSEPGAASADPGGAEEDAGPEEASVPRLAPPGARGLAITPVIPEAARPLPLAAVRLTGGPLKRAQDLNAGILLDLEPDRMLAGYRMRAGLPPKARGYGGWDAVEGKQLTGHLAGHYLSGVSLMYAATGDPRFQERADHVVRELKEVQDHRGTGYLGALTDGQGTDAAVLFEQIARGDIRSGGFDLNGMWSPWYTLHKTYAGLRDAWRYTGHPIALELEIRFAAWAESILGRMSDAQVQRMLNTEFGGMNEVFADLYADTGDPRWLRLSHQFEHRAFTEPLQRHQDRLAGTHGNTQVPKLIGSLARFHYLGEPGDGFAASFFWDRVVQHHSYATGGHGKDEYFGEPGRLNDRVDGRVAETCNVYNMLKLTRRMFALRPDPHYADFLERALFNHILASQDPEEGWACYMVPVGRGVQREYERNMRDGGFTCCTGSSLESHALHGHGLYAAAADTLWVNTYAPSTAEWAEAGVTLIQETDFPEGESVRLTLKLSAPKTFTLAVRRPFWTDAGFAVRVNGVPVPAASLADPASAIQRPRGGTPPEPATSWFVRLERSWETGDTVSVTLPKRLRLEPLPDNPRRVALLWGPLVLAGDLGPEETGRGAGRRSATFDSVPVFVAAERPLSEWLAPVPERPGWFRTVGVGQDREVEFEPFYRLHRRTYAVYWDLFTPAEWEVRAAEIAAERERQQRREAATVGFVQPGEMQAERDANMQGEETAPDRVMGRAGRRARGWFSFELPVDPAHPMALVVTYNLDEWRERTFDILVDGTRVGQQRIERRGPMRFFDVEYPIPADLVRDRQRVTVRFQATEGNEVGAVFGLRMIRADAER